MFQSSFPFLEVQSQDARLFDHFRGRWDDESRRIPGFGDKVGLKHQPGTKFSGFGFNLRIEINNIQIAALDFHLGSVKKYVLHLDA